MSEGSEWGPLSGSPVQGWAFCVPGALLGLMGGMTGVPCVYGASENKGAEKPHRRHPVCDKWGIREDSLPEYRLRKRAAATIKCPRGAGWIKGLAEISITNARGQGVCWGLSGSELRRGCSQPGRTLLALGKVFAEEPETDRFLACPLGSSTFLQPGHVARCFRSLGPGRGRILPSSWVVSSKCKIMHLGGFGDHV